MIFKCEQLPGERLKYSIGVAEMNGVHRIDCDVPHRLKLETVMELVRLELLRWVCADPNNVALTDKGKSTLHKFLSGHELRPILVDAPLSEFRFKDDPIA